MVDIGADLALKVTEAFQKLYEDDIAIKVLTKRLEGNKAKLDDAHRYSMRVGELLAQVYRDEISGDVLPDGKMYWNIANKVVKEPLENNYKLAVEASMKAIEAQNKAKGIGLKVVRPKLAADRLKGLIDKVSDAEKYDDVAFALDRPVANFTAKACDDTVQANANFQSEAGLSVKVVRTPRGAHTCDWCKSVAGSYDYSKVKNGHDVWRRHADCDCLIEFVSDKGREVVRNYRLSNKAKITEREALGGINERRLDFENAQEYRSVEYGEPSKRHRGSMVVSGAKLKNTRNAMWVANDAHLSRKKQHKLDKMLDNIYKNLSVGEDAVKPEVIIFSANTMQTLAKASYNAVLNELYINAPALDADDFFVTVAHELYHWEDAQNYKETIVEANYNDYLLFYRKQHKKKVEKLGITADNVSKLGPYAVDMLDKGKFEEVYTEYRAKKLEGEIKI